MEFTKRKKIILMGMLALIVCVGVLNNKLSNDQNLATTAGYEDYEAEQMDLHDGDVLVDSANVAELPSTTGTAVDPNAAADPNAAPGGQAPGETTDTNGKIIDTIAGGAAVPTNAEAAAVDPIDKSLIVTSDNLEELANADTYFEEVRATINMDRNQVISMLTDVIEETKDGPEKNNATQQKLKIINYMNTEKVVENLIKNKGFTDALVLITDNSVNVTVYKQEISQSDVAKICDIVIRETGRDASQIVIQSKY